MVSDNSCSHQLASWSCNYSKRQQLSLKNRRKIASQHHFVCRPADISSWRYWACTLLLLLPFLLMWWSSLNSCWRQVAAVLVACCLIWPLNLIQFMEKISKRNRWTTTASFGHQTTSSSNTLRPHASVLFKVWLKSTPDWLSRNSIHLSLLLLLFKLLL